MQKSIGEISDYKIYNYHTPTGDFYLPEGPDDDVVITAIKRGYIYDEWVYEIGESFVTEHAAVIDVGSNFGQMSILYSNKAKKVYSIECYPPIIWVLKKNIELSNRNNIVLIDKAAYNVTGKELYYPIPDFKKYSSFGSYGLNPLSKDGKKIITIKIDDIDIDIDVCFMKVDVQGSDLFAMQGAINTINKYRMPIIYEYEENYDEQFNVSRTDYENFVKDIDYVLQDKHDCNYFIVAREKYDSSW